MADIASQLLEFPPETLAGKTLSPEEYDRKLNDFLKTTLSKLSSSKVLATDVDQDLLQIIDPAVNSLSYLFVLRLRLFEGSGKPKSPQGINTATWNHAVEFLTRFDGVQIRYVGLEFRTLIELMLQAAPRLNMTQEILAATRTAIFRLDPSAGTLTSTHLLFIRQCLQLRALPTAAPLLESTIHSFPPSKSLSIDGALPCHPHTESTGYITDSSGLTSTLSIADVQEYFLLSAITWIGLRRWEDALMNLELVLTSPIQGSPSGLMLEAYQKWVIVGCLIYGRAIDAPKSISASVLKPIKLCSKAYDSVVEVFGLSDLSRLQAQISAGTLEFSADGNMGLIQQLPLYLPRFHLLRLQKTYSALTLSMVAAWLAQSPDEAHAFIEGLINTGGLNARIEFRGGANQEPVLRFFSDQASGPLAKSEMEYNMELVNQAARTNAMVDFVKMADRRIVLTKDYVEGLRKRLRNKDEDGLLGTLEGIDPLWDAPGYQDEDLMLDS